MVLADAIPGARVRDAALILCGALLTVLGAQIAIQVPPSPVPITGQTLAVVLAGGALGARRGASSQLLYLVLGLFLPVYSDGAQGLDVLWGATGGYIVGFILAAYLVGRLAERGADRRPLVACFAVRRRPALDLRDRRAVAEGRDRHELGRRDPLRLHDLHRGRDREGAARGRADADRLAARQPPVTELPAGTFVLTADARRPFADAVLGDPEADPSVDALWIFTSGLPGMGIDLVEVFASVGCSMTEDGPMLGGTEFELHRPIEVDRPYRRPAGS